jgi:hypothetical protein
LSCDRRYLQRVSFHLQFPQVHLSYTAREESQAQQLDKDTYRSTSNKVSGYYLYFVSQDLFTIIF